MTAILYRPQYVNSEWESAGHRIIWHPTPICLNPNSREILFVPGVDNQIYQQDHEIRWHF